MVKIQEIVGVPGSGKTSYAIHSYSLMRSNEHDIIVYHHDLAKDGVRYVAKKHADRNSNFAKIHDYTAKMRDLSLDDMLNTILFRQKINRIMYNLIIESGVKSIISEGFFVPLNPSILMTNSFKDTYATLQQRSINRHGVSVDEELAINQTNKIMQTQEFLYNYLQNLNLVSESRSKYSFLDSRIPYSFFDPRLVSKILLEELCLPSNNSDIKEFEIGVEHGLKHL